MDKCVSCVFLSVVAKLKCWILHVNFSTTFSMPAMLIGTIDINHLIPLSATLTLAIGHSSAESKPAGFIFSHTFELISTKCDVVLKQFMLNTLTLLLSVIYLIKRNNCCSTDRIKKNVHAGMHLDICESM